MVSSVFVELLSSLWTFTFHAGSFPGKWVYCSPESFLTEKCRWAEAQCEVYVFGSPHHLLNHIWKLIDCCRGEAQFLKGLFSNCQRYYSCWHKDEHSLRVSIPKYFNDLLSIKSFSFLSFYFIIIIIISILVIEIKFVLEV